MPLRRFRRQYEQLSQFERGRIIGMMEAGWSVRRIARPLGHSDCVTNRREDRHIVRNAREQPTASLAALQAQVAPSLGAPVSFRTIRRCLDEGHLGSRCPLRVLPLTPTHQRLRLEWCRARGNWTAAEWTQVIFNVESRFNLSSEDNRVRV
ncbi:transposable element Tcb2 transposase [Trichonephila clavipes]|nr:transposable element Tcb2 transposase [Trichonephila clavipes]